MLPPEKHTFDTLWGHGPARTLVPRLLAAGRLPHAILLTGPDAIGKRSLAFAMAKAILSAGRPAATVSLSVGDPPKAKRQVPDDEPEEDLFGGSEEPEADLFGEDPAPPPPPPLPGPVKQPVLATAPLPPPSQPGRKPLRAQFLGFDPRVCRLVEASYPVDYTSDGIPKNVGHVDLTIIEPSGRRSILVDQIRYLKDVASIPPVEGTFRVALVFGADTITPEAGNSILKLLEEPPSYLIMILVANRTARVLPTIKSRCAIVPMSPLDRATLTEKLIDVEKLDRSRAEVAAALCEGRPGVALTMLESGLMERRKEVFAARLQVDRFGIAAVPHAAARIAGTGKLEESLWLLLSFTRDRLVRQLAPDHPRLLIHGDATDLIEGKKADPLALDAEADRLLSSVDLLAHPYLPNQRAVLELALWPE